MVLVIVLRAVYSTAVMTTKTKQEKLKYDERFLSSFRFMNADCFICIFESQADAKTYLICRKIVIFINNNKSNVALMMMTLQTFEN